MLAPILPFLAEAMYQNLVVSVDADAARQRPPDALAGRRPRAAPRRARWRRAMATVRAGRRAGADAARPGRHPAAPAARAGVARRSRSAALAIGDELLALIARRGQRQGRSSVIGDESELVERRVKPLLPKIGKRLGSAIPAVMAAARDGRGRDPCRTGR